MAFCVPSAFQRPTDFNYIVPSANPYTEGEFVTPSPLSPPVGPISGISVFNITETGFSVTLNPVSKATNYQFSWGTFSKNNTQPNTVFTGLPLGTSNSLLITAYNEDGSIFSTPQTVTTLTPSPSKPSGLVATSVGTTSFDVSWNASAYASSYSALWGTTSPSSATGTRASFTGLPFGTTSNVVVYASNAVGTTASDPLPVSTRYPTPGQPTGVTAYNILSTSFDCSWSPASFGQTYSALWGSYSGLVSGTTASFTGLTPSSTSNLVIYVTNPGGSNSSSPVAVTTNPPAPATPSNVAAYNITGTSFDCSWSPAEYASSYSATWGSYSGSVAGTTASFTSLPSATSNSLVVTASNVTGLTSSLPITVATSNTTPPPAPPTGVTTTRRGTDYMEATWSNVPGVTYVALVNSSPSNVVVTGNTCRATGLTPGSGSNSLIIRAVNGGGSNASDPIYFDLLSPRFYTAVTPVSPLIVYPASGFSAQDLGTWYIPNDYDVSNNDTLISNVNNVFFDKWFEYVPYSTAGAFMAFRACKGSNVNVFENEFVAYLPTSGTGAEWGQSNRPNPPSWGSSNVWTFQPNDAYTMFFLIPYPLWDVLLGEVNEISFTYNPFESP